MRTFLLRLPWLLVLLIVAECVDPYEPAITQAVNMVVVDGTITNLAEPQIIRLSRSLTISGQPGNLRLSGARVEVVVDSSQVIQLPETTEKGAYRLPDDFRGQAGHRYQLRFQLSDGTQYESSQQLMATSPPITKVSARFNPTSLPPDVEGYSAAHELYLDTQDPANERNYYQWQWALYEKQAWCRTCYEGEYAVYKVDVIDTNGNPTYHSGTELLEDCWTYPLGSLPRRQLQANNADYACRTQCWEIIHSHGLDLFDDALIDGGLIQGRKIAQIPFYQHSPCLVEIRQLALTKDAHRFYKLLESQTQKTGGLADTPPAAPVGNVKNMANGQEMVVGFFTAAGVSTHRYWLDRKDAFGKARGLFQSLNGRDPQVEKVSFIIGGPPRPPTAVCVYSDSRTPFKPEGWQE